jgi:hypothetical protein
VRLDENSPGNRPIVSILRPEANKLPRGSPGAGYCVPPDLFDRLPEPVILAIHRGQPVIPMNAHKKPLVKWKRYQQHMPKSAEIRYWLNNFGDEITGWARVTGRISGVIVLDDDGGGWLERWGLQPHVRTGSGGLHWIGKHPGWPVKTLNAVTFKKLADAFPKLDIRGDGGYSIISGFTVKGGYQWLRDPEPDPLDLLPQHVRRFFGLEEPPRYNHSRPPANQNPGLPDEEWASRAGSAENLIVGALSVASRCGRNNAGIWLACQLRDNGHTQAQAETIGADYVRRVAGSNTRGECEEYTEEEYRKSVGSAYSRPPRAPWSENGR